MNTCRMGGSPAAEAPEVVDVDVADRAPVVVEAAPPSPGLGFVWIGGAWVWNNGWVWESGRWQHPPHPGAVWRPHRYENRDGKHVFIRGGWN